MNNIRGKYVASHEGMAVSDISQFFQLRGAAGAVAEVLEVRVWQTSDVSLAVNAIHFERGTGGAGGTDRANDEYVTDFPTALFDAFDTAPSTEVTTVDLNIRVGWNILQEMVWLPTPEIQIWLKEEDDLALSLVTTDTLTMGYTVSWREYQV